MAFLFVLHLFDIHIIKILIALLDNLYQESKLNDIKDILIWYKNNLNIPNYYEWTNIWSFGYQEYRSEQITNISFG